MKKKPENEALPATQLDKLLNANSPNELLAQIRRISQDHPELVVQLIQTWVDDDKRQLH